MGAFPGQFVCPVFLYHEGTERSDACADVRTTRRVWLYAPALAVPGPCGRDEGPSV